MTRTYTVILEACGDKAVTREMPCSHAEAREMAAGMASRNKAWLGSRWSARDGDSFVVSLSGDISDLSLRDIADELADEHEDACYETDGEAAYGRED